jgi:hypothetical protein
MSKKAKTYKVFAFYLLIMAIIQIASFVTSKLKIHNIFLTHFYFVIQFLILSYFYFLLLIDLKQKLLIKIITPLVVTNLIIYYYNYPLDFYIFNPFEIFITSLPLVIYTTFHLYNLLNQDKKFYYINLGLLIYLFGSTLVFLTGNLLLLIDGNYVFDIIWSFNEYIYVVYQLLILKDIYPLSKQWRPSLK